MNGINARNVTRMLLTGALFVLVGGETQACHGRSYHRSVRPVYCGTSITVAYASYRPVRYYGYYAGCCDPCCCCTLCCNPCCTCDPCCCGGCFETSSCCEPAIGYGEGDQLIPAQADQPTPAPTEVPTAAPAPAPAATPTPAPAPEAADTSARIEVTLPAEARVYVNDRLTTSTGNSRQYRSAGLRPGGSYAYRIRVEYQHQGQEVVERRTVHMRAGQRIALEFPNTELAEAKTSTARLASFP